MPLSFSFLPHLVATYIILHTFDSFVNTYKKKKKKKTMTSLTAGQIFSYGGGTEIWTPDTAGMNRML